MPLRSRIPDKGLDETAKRFLGNAGDDVVRRDGQKADDDKLRHSQERMLLAEACEYGDDLVRYVAMHQNHTGEELAWGFCLGLYCARRDYPDGDEAFDDVAEQAGKDLVLAQTTVVSDPDEAVRIQTELQQFEDASFRRAAAFAENFASFLDRKKRQLGLGNKQGAYGLGRAFHNLRQTFPQDKGGSAAFDELARRAGIYFADNQ